MARKGDEPVSSRPVIAVRPPSDLREKLEAAAEENGRPISKEAEYRIEKSFEDASASKLERYIKNRPGLTYMIGMKAPLELTNQLGEVLLSVVRYSEDRGWSEIQTREALAAATNVVSHYYFWRGGKLPPVPDVRPIPPADTKKKDLPPALAGFVIAEEQMLFSASLQDHALYNQTVDRKIASVWSGDGRVVEDVSLAESHPVPKRRLKSDVGGLTVPPEELDRFKAALPLWYQVLKQREAEQQLAAAHRG